MAGIIWLHSSQSDVIIKTVDKQINYSATERTFMKKLLLVSLLTFAAVSTARAELFKLEENSLVCNDYEPLKIMVDHIQNNPNRDRVGEMLAYLFDSEMCVQTRPNVIVRIVDVEGPLYRVHAINENATVWVHRAHIIN